MLRARGERPSILTRGYGRRVVTDGVVVVRDEHGIRADLGRSGDEPLMLARQLEGVSIFVSPDRYVAGRLAESRFGCTVHLLDDGFQHIRLERDIDLLLIRKEDVDAPVTLPSGRLREPLDAAVQADAILVPDVSLDEAKSIGAKLGVSRTYCVTSSIGMPRWLERDAPEPFAAGEAVVAVAGIARPERFFASLERAGWKILETVTFPDHHSYDRRDAQRMVETARRTGATAILTTEKDAVRLLPLRPLHARIAWIPLHVSIDPAGEFDSWVCESVAHAREARRAP